MPPVRTPAIILATHPYSETSRIVRLATRDHGVQSAIAKGARRPKSRFGAALQVLSSGEAEFLLSDRRDLHTLTAFDVSRVPVELTADLGRYSTAMALAEVMLRVAPAEPHPEAFDVLEGGLAALSQVSPQGAALGVHLLWQLVGALGFAPSLDTCVRDARPLGDGRLAFSAPEGGGLCPVCARSAEVTDLPAEARLALARLMAPTGVLPDLDGRNTAAHRRLVARYIRLHLAEGAALPALEFWQREGWVRP
jgi:DNA repair protein RecO (recombination protein O)